MWIKRNREKTRLKKEQKKLEKLGSNQHNDNLMAQSIKYQSNALDSMTTRNIDRLRRTK